MGLLDDMENKAVTSLVGASSKPPASGLLEMINNHPVDSPDCCSHFTRRDWESSYRPGSGTASICRFRPTRFSKSWGVTR